MVGDPLQGTDQFPTVFPSSLAISRRGELLSNNVFSSLVYHFNGFDLILPSHPLFRPQSRDLEDVLSLR